MESIGLPCDHIIAVLLYLDIGELPKSLVLNRWSKNAKHQIRGSYPQGTNYWDCHLVARYACLVQISRQLCEYAYRDDEDYESVIQLLSGELNRLKLKNSESVENPTMDAEDSNGNILDPIRVQSKGCGTIAINHCRRRTRVQTCRICGAHGHNKRLCPNRLDNPRHEQVPILSAEDMSNSAVNCVEFNNQQFNDHAEAFIPSSSHGFQGQRHQ